MSADARGVVRRPEKYVRRINADAVHVIDKHAAVVITVTGLEMRAAGLRSMALQHALANQRKPWARRWLRINFMKCLRA